MILEAQLGEGESLVWSGRSSDKLLIRSDYVFVLGGALIGVIALGAFVSSLLALFRGDAEAATVGLPVSIAVGAVGLYLVFGRLISRYRRGRRKSYAITDKRVIELTRRDDPSKPPFEKTVALADEPATSLQNHFERRGTITVGSIKLENIDDAPVVFELLSAALANAHR
ncbi:MAG: hypothetical protein JHD02_06285 [Thermoleophilaceae bacterium]|nr:hypothetical protein [Thermoleophilaceae bacterium]